MFSVNVNDLLKFFFGRNTCGHLMNLACAFMTRLKFNTVIKVIRPELIQTIIIWMNPLEVMSKSQNHINSVYNIINRMKEKQLIKNTLTDYGKHKNTTIQLSKHYFDSFILFLASVYMTMTFCKKNWFVYIFCVQLNYNKIIIKRFIYFWRLRMKLILGVWHCLCQCMR